MFDSSSSEQYDGLTPKSSDAKRLLSSLLETAPDAMLIIDEHGAILLANSQTEDMFGYSREELLGKPVQVLIPPRFHEAHTRHFAQFFSAPRQGAASSVTVCVRAAPPRQARYR